MGGSDSAQPRYIHTKLPKIISNIFNANDSFVLDYINDDGLLVEPEFYVPIIPMILVNGSEGIGTGWSTFVPSFNPTGIINNIKTILKKINKNNNIYSKEFINEIELEELNPWYRGFTGSIVKTDTNSYMSYGIYKRTNSSQVEIQELPIRSWTDKYKEFLESMIIDNSKDKKKSNQCLRNYSSQCSDTRVSFTLTFATDTLDDILYDESRNKDGLNKFEKLFKLSSKVNTSNMVLYDRNGFLKKYKNPNDILKDFMEVRLECYVNRKNYQLKNLEKELIILNARVKFILEFISGDIVIAKRSKNDLIEQLVNRKYPNIDKDELIDNSVKHSTNGFDYLIKMPIYNLTQERIDELNKDKDMKTEMYQNLKDKSIDRIYYDELIDLEKEYKKFLSEKAKNEEFEPKKKKVFGKKKK
jgi:DNA topoisomerase-2